MATLTRDFCRICKVVKPIKEFCKDNSRMRGYAYNCKTCQSQKMAQLRQDDPRYRQYQRAYSKKRYGENRKEMNELHRNYANKRYKNDPEWRKKRIESNRIFKASARGHETSRAAVQRYKDRVFAAYGGYTCICCGVDGEVFMAIDHINGRKNVDHPFPKTMRGNRLWTWLTRNGFPKGFQILCWNCNAAKHIKGVCPHQKGT